MFSFVPPASRHSFFFASVFGAATGRMGSLFKCLDPGPPDESVRQFWHVHGLLLDAAQPSCSTEQQQHQRQAAEHSPSVDTLQVVDGCQGKQAKVEKAKKLKNKAKEAEEEEEEKAAMEDNNNQKKNKKKKTRGKTQQREVEQQQQLQPKLTVQRLPPGVLFVYEGRLVYRARHWSPCCPWPIGSSSIDHYGGGGGADPDVGECQNGRTSPPNELSVELCQIGAVNVTQQFVSQRDNKPVRCHCSPVVDILVTGRQPPLHIGILIAQADAVGKELRECFLKHRHRPRIFQFNSVDVDGIEIDVP